MKENDFINGSKMIIPIPTDTDYIELDEIAVKCGVNRDDVANWISQGLLIDASENNKQLVETLALVKFLHVNKFFKPLENLYHLEALNMNWEEFYNMQQRFFTKGRIKTIQHQNLFSEFAQQIVTVVKQISDIEQRNGIKSPINNSPVFTCIENDTYKRLSVKDITQLCAVSNKTVFSWSKNGLKLKKSRKKRGDLYTTLLELITFFESDKKYFKYLKNIFTNGLNEYEKQLEERLAEIKRKTKSKGIENSNQVDAKIKSIKNSLQNLNIKITDLDTGVTNLSPDEFIQNHVVNRYGITNDDFAIGKELLRKLRVWKMNDSEGVKYIKKKKNKIYQHRMHLCIKSKIDELCIEKPQFYDEIMKVYSEILREKNWKPININLPRLGLTNEFLKKAFIEQKERPLKRLFAHIMPYKTFTASSFVKTYFLLDYIDSFTGQIILQLLFNKETSKYKLKEMELYAVCRFLHEGTWTTHDDLSMKDRVAGIAILLGVKRERINEKIRDCEKKIGNRIKNLINPKWHGNPETDLIVLYESRTKKNTANETEPNNNDDNQKKLLDYNELKRNYGMVDESTTINAMNKEFIQSTLLPIMNGNLLPKQYIDFMHDYIKQKKDMRKVVFDELKCAVGNNLNTVHYKKLKHIQVALFPECK